MGILNVTPDSFSDGGAFLDCDKAVVHARQMVADGADIVDVGGESTRPGADSVSTFQEIDRVVPVIERLAHDLSVLISVDTSKPAVMRAAVAAGAGLINDVRALREPGALEAAAETKRPICLMHMRGDPRTMQRDPEYRDVVREVHDFLQARMAAAMTAGIARERIIIDPGFGFGKTPEHNLALLRHLRDLGGLAPIMVGLSRKSMIEKLLGLSMEQRTCASVALAVVAAQNGARIVRVHDVAGTVQALRMLEAIYPPAYG